MSIDRDSIKSYKALTKCEPGNVSTHVIDNYTDHTKVNLAKLNRLLISLGFRDMKHAVDWTNSNRKGGVRVT